MVKRSLILEKTQATFKTNHDLGVYEIDIRRIESGLNLDVSEVLHRIGILKIIFNKISSRKELYFRELHKAYSLQMIARQSYGSSIKKTIQITTKNCVMIFQGCYYTEVDKSSVTVQFDSVTFPF